MNKRGAEALRAALAQTDAAPPSDTAEAVKALGPHLHAASLKLEDKRRERRSMGLQALALAGCSGVFTILLALACQYRATLAEQPVQWGTALGIVILALLAVVCLPIMLKERETNP